MSGVQRLLCRLCLKIITHNSFEVIDNAIRYILHFLLLKLKFDDENKEVICSACIRKLNAASEFKSICLNTDNTIIPYVDSEKMLELDMTELYKRETGSELMDISDSQRICRLCMQPVPSEFRCIREEELEAIEKLAPEMIINIIKDPVVCKTCFDSVCTHNNFLRICIEVKEKMSSAIESPTDTSPSHLFNETEKLNKKFDIEETKLSIKDECIDIKSEDEEKSDTSPQISDNEPFEKSDCKDAEEDECRHESRSVSESSTEATQEHRVSNKCDKSFYGTEMYRCDNCDYETKYKRNIKQHQLKHKDPSQIPMYRCNECDYEAKCRRYIKRHQLKHKDPSQVQMYRCSDCNYKSIYMTDINRHQLIHKDPSQVQMYRCDNCDFETKYKRNIKQHQLKHKDPSQIQMYRCNECDYEAKYRHYIIRHQLKHKDSSQVQVHRCNDCNYKSIYMTDFNRHQLKHKDPSQVQMYSCNNCDYKSLYQRSVKRHQVKHEDPSQIQMYKCNICNYETKYKRNINQHQLKHKDPSQVQMYRCYNCNFETKYKKGITQHLQTHKDPSQIHIYGCDYCDYKSKFQRSIKRHQLKHKESLQV